MLNSEDTEKDILSIIKDLNHKQISNIMARAIISANLLVENRLTETFNTYALAILNKLQNVDENDKKVLQELLGHLSVHIIKNDTVIDTIMFELTNGTRKV